MGSIIAMPLAEATVTIGQGPKETTLIFYCVLFFLVLIYVSLYVFVPFLHNVSRETPPSELPRTFFLIFLNQCDSSMYLFLYLSMYLLFVDCRIRLRTNSLNLIQIVR